MTCRTHMADIGWYAGSGWSNRYSYWLLNAIDQVCRYGDTGWCGHGERRRYYLRPYLGAFIHVCRGAGRVWQGSTSTMVMWELGVFWYLVIFDYLCWYLCTCMKCVCVCVRVRAYNLYAHIELCMRVLAYALHKHIHIYTYCRWYVWGCFVRKSMLDQSEGMEELQGEAWRSLSPKILSSIDDWWCTTIAGASACELQHQRCAACISSSLLLSEFGVLFVMQLMHFFGDQVNPVRCISGSPQGLRAEGWGQTNQRMLAYILC